MLFSAVGPYPMYLQGYEVLFLHTQSILYLASNVRHGTPPLTPGKSGHGGVGCVLSTKGQPLTSAQNENIKFHTK